METHPQRPKKKLLDQARDILRALEYAKRTEETYIHWITRFVLFHGKRHPQDMGASEVREFLTHLAVKEGIAASTQNQALCALSFLYRDLIKHAETTEQLTKMYVKRPLSLPNIVAKEEVRRLLDAVAPGYYELTRPKAWAEDRVILLDHSIQLRQDTLFVVLEIRESQIDLTHPLQYQELTPSHHVKNVLDRRDRSKRVNASSD